MAKGVAIDEKVKAQAIALLVAGQGPKSVAKELGLNPESVKNWQRNLRKPGPNNPVQNMTPPQRAQLGELIVTAMEEALGAFIERQKFTRNEKWLMRQNAADLAVLDGVTADKIILMAAAMQRARQSALPAPSEPA